MSEQNPQAIQLFKNGLNHAEKGRLESAIFDWTHALFIQPDFTDAYEYRGMARRDNKDFVGAIADLSEAIRLRPEKAGTYYRRARVYEEKGELSKAIEDFTKVIELLPNSVKTYMHRALLYIRQQAYEQALKDFNAVLHLNPADGIAYCHRGNLHIRLGNMPAAIQDIEQFLTLCPLHPITMHWQQWLAQVKSAASVAPVPVKAPLPVYNEGSQDAERNGMTTHWEGVRAFREQFSINNDLPPVVPQDPTGLPAYPIPAYEPTVQAIPTHAIPACVVAEEIDVTQRTESSDKAPIHAGDVSVVESDPQSMPILGIETRVAEDALCLDVEDTSVEQGEFDAPIQIPAEKFFGKYPPTFYPQSQSGFVVDDQGHISVAAMPQSPELAIATATMRPISQALVAPDAHTIPPLHTTFQPGELGELPTETARRTKPQYVVRYVGKGQPPVALELAAETLANFAFAQSGAPEQVVGNEEVLWGLINRTMTESRWTVEIGEFRDGTVESSEHKMAAILDLHQKPHAMLVVRTLSPDEFLVQIVVSTVPSTTGNRLLCWETTLKEKIPARMDTLDRWLYRLVERGILVNQDKHLRLSGKQ